MKMYIEQLVDAVSPPLRPCELPKSIDWSRVEGKIGSGLPQDYKWYVEVYGTGLLCGFIIVANPFSGGDHVNLLSLFKETAEDLRGLKQAEGMSGVPYSVFPEIGGLLCWGRDENGNSYYWLTKGDPAEWTVAIGAARECRWQHFEMSLTEFMFKALTRKIKVKLWPRDYPPKLPELAFKPFKAS